MRSPDIPENTTLKIFVAGGSGFIGSRLISRLTEENPQDGQQLKEIFCMTRDPQSIKEMFSKEVKLVKADVSDHIALSNAMPRKIDVAYYLLHSMEGRSKEWKRFSERDRVAAMNFAKVASECGIKRIIYLCGLVDLGDNEKNLSEHMRSRLEVGEILRKYSTSKVTIFRAAVILGQGSGSFQMLQFLVERLPIMVCPRWVLSKCQPIAVEDVVEYLAKSIEVTETEGKIFEIGGPEIFTYYEMMKTYAEIINKSVRIIIIPFLTPRLSSYWVDLVTPLKASLARPLIDSLKHDAIMHDDSVRKVIPIRLKSFSEAIHLAGKEKSFRRQQNRLTNGRSNHNISHKYLIVSLGHWLRSDHCISSLTKALKSTVTFGSSFLLCGLWQPCFHFTF